MATRKRGNKTPLDPNNPSNWTSSELKEELNKIGIRITDNLSNKQLRRIYLDNKTSRQSSSEHDQTNAIQTDIYLDSGEHAVSDTPVRVDNFPSTETCNIAVTSDGENCMRLNNFRTPVERRNTGIETSEDRTSAHTDCAFPPSVYNKNNNSSSLDYALLSNTIALCQQALSTCANQGTKFTLSTAMNGYQPNISTPSSNVQTMLGEFGSGPGLSTCARDRIPIYSVSNQPARFGFPASAFAGVDMVSPELRSKIISGKDINLNSLLLPNYENPSKQKNKDNDERLKRNLSLHEFITAFGRYKRIMCSAFPQRAEELDAYLQHIIETANVWPAKFYEYHKMFSAKCAIMLQEHNIKIDWSLGDPELRQLVCAGSRVNMCTLCSSTLHTTSMCSSYSARNQFQYTRNHTVANFQDRYGKDALMYEGVQICNNFNTTKGCPKPYCRYRHVCKTCFGHGHGQFQCPASKSPISGKQPESNMKNSKQPVSSSVKTV